MIFTTRAWAPTARAIPYQQGTGTAVSSDPSNFTEGNLTQTGVSTDVAIDGNGFFVVQNSSGVESFTRAGNFEVSTDNYLETSDGQQVLGYQAVNGVIDSAAASARWLWALGLSARLPLPRLCR